MMRGYKAHEIKTHLNDSTTPTLRIASAYESASQRRVPPPAFGPFRPASAPSASERTSTPRGGTWKNLQPSLTLNTALIARWEPAPANPHADLPTACHGR